MSIATVSFMTRSCSPCSCSQGQVNVNDSLPLICGSLQLLPVFCASLRLGANVARSQTPRLSKQLTSGSVDVEMLQVAGNQALKEAGKPVKVAESDVDVSMTIRTLEPF